MSERAELAAFVGKRIPIEFTVFGSGEYGFLIKYIKVVGKEYEFNHTWVKDAPPRLQKVEPGQRMRATAVVETYNHKGRGIEYTLTSLDNLKWIQERSF